MSYDPLEAYLSEQSEVGQRDSEGSFTVSAEKALDKLASHQLPRTSAWILKMVQAGVVAGASGMWVSHGLRGCKIRYKEGAFPTLEELRSAWIEPLPIENEVELRLSVALRAVAFARRRPVLVVQNCPDTGPRTLFWNGASMGRIVPAEGKMKTTVTVGETLFYVSRSPLAKDDTVKKIHGVSDVTAAEFKELTNYAVCSPMPLWADNRPLNHFGMEDVSMIRKSLAFSAQQTIESGPTLALPPSVRESTEVTRAGLAWTLYHSNRPEPSCLSWVKDGVVCEEENLHLHPDHYKVRLFVPADDIETDLTALQLRFPSRDLKNRRTAQAVLGFCRELSPNSPVAAEIGESQKGKSGAWSMASLVIVGGILMAPATGGYSFLASAGAALGLYARKATDKAKAPPALKRFVFQLEKRYDGHG